MTVFLVGNQVMLRLPNGKVRRTGILINDDDYPERLWYVSPRREDHIFRIHDGWGIGVEIIEFLEGYNVYGVKLVIEGKRRLVSSIPQLRLHGHKEKHEGFEEQIVMNEKLWLGDGQAML